MLGDSGLGREVNLTECSKQDIYNSVAVTLADRLHVTRDTVKRVIMTIPYNATVYRGASYLASALTAEQRDSHTFYKGTGQELTWDQLMTIADEIRS